MAKVLVPSLAAAGVSLALLLCGPGGALLSQLAAEAERGRDIDRRFQPFNSANESKRIVIDELLAGRLSLADAAERFGRLGAGRERKLQIGAVLDWATATLGPAPEASRAEALARLKEQRARLEGEAVSAPISAATSSR